MRISDTFDKRLPAGKFARLLIAGALATTLAGCVQSDGQTGATTTGGEVDPAALIKALATDSVGPGSESVDVQNGAMLFGEICADTAPSFRTAPAVMAKMPFRQHKGTGTYYHQNLDLSVKLFADRCSMVFGSNEDATQLGMMFAVTATMKSNSNSTSVDPDTGASASKGPKGTSFEFAPLPTRGPRPMYRAVLFKP